MVSAFDVTAVILCGGKSTRMGRDKALIKIAGRPLVQHAADELCQIFQKVFINTNTPLAYEGFGLPIVTDREAQWGALAGIDAAFAAATTPWIFALACDMPLVDSRVIEHVLAAATEDAAVVVPHGHGFHQPFHAAYGPLARRALEQWRGRPLTIHHFLKEVPVIAIGEEEMQKVAPGLECLLQANKPEELEQLKPLLEARADRMK